MSGGVAELPDIVHDLPPVGTLDITARPVPPLQRLYRDPLVRRVTILVLLAALWQGYASYADNPLLFPTLTDTVRALASGILSGEILARCWVSLKTLLTGYALGVTVAAVLTALATCSLIGASLLETLTAMLNPLPSIALLPLALLWFGIGQGSLIFVLLHAVTWVVAMNTVAGFRAVSPTLRMVGHNYGLGLFRYLAQILVPAAFPSILSGLKTGWAFAWRTLVAAELIFGASSGSGGLGWYIFENKNDLEIANVFAGLLTVIVIGLLVDSLLFRTIERHTVHRWGMQQR
jgi:NitT/TauT family transport system permease protein